MDFSRKRIQRCNTIYKIFNGSNKKKLAYLRTCSYEVDLIGCCVIDDIFTQETGMI